VASERSLLDRVFGCGTLNVQTAGEAGTVSLVDVPEVEQVHQTMTELLFGASLHSWSEPRG
jgi:membrane protein YdbS with pleckstrin-like domain